MISLDNSNMIFDLQSMPYGKGTFLPCVVYNGVENTNPPYGIHGKFQSDITAVEVLNEQRFNSLTSGSLIIADPYLGESSSQNSGYYYNELTNYFNPKGISISTKTNLSLIQYASATPPTTFQINYYYMQSELEKILSTDSTIKYLCMAACYKQGAPFVNNYFFQDDTNISQDLDPIYTMHFLKMPTSLSSGFLVLNFKKNNSNSAYDLCYSTITTNRSTFFKNALNNPEILNSYTLLESREDFLTYNSLYYLPIGYVIKNSRTSGCNSISTDCYYLRLYVIERPTSNPITKEEMFNCAKNYIYDEAIYIQKK